MSFPSGEPSKPSARSAPRALHLLIVSYGYAPLRHVSAVRATNMARELVERGVEVSVLTADWSRPSAPASVDETLERALAGPLPRALAVQPHPGQHLTEPHEEQEAAGSPALLRKFVTLWRMIRWGRHGAWARRAFAAASRLHAARPIDVVWAIRGDDSCHVIAWRLCRELGIPWVADFKDPWDVFHSSAVARILQHRLTARRLRTARVLTETCAAQAEQDERRFAVPTHVVYSGYDPGQIAAAEPIRPADGFCISYLGGVHVLHDVSGLGPLFAALAAHGALERYRIGLHQFGTPDPTLPRILSEAGCAERMHSHAPVSRQQAYSLMRGSDLLLLFPMNRGAGRAVGVKELEYFAAGTPVLLLGEPLAELAPLIRALPQVCVARDAEAAASFVEDTARATGDARRGAVNAPALAEFCWSAQAARLHGILSAVAGAG